MALSLKLNGSTTASIPGSPANGDTIAMDNGFLRLSFSFGDHVSSNWCMDKFEVWDGAAWQIGGYFRDRIRMNVPTSGEITGTHSFSIQTNTASQLTMRLNTSMSGASTTYTVVFDWTMRNTHNLIEEQMSFSTAAITTGTSDLFGPAYLSAGKTGDMLKLFMYADNPGNSDSQSTNRMMIKTNDWRDRTFAKPNQDSVIANLTARGYGNGAAYLRNNNVLVMTYYDPLSYANLIETQGAFIDYIYAFNNYADWWNGVDAKYQANHDNMMFLIQPGISKINTTAGTTYTMKNWMGGKMMTESNDDTIVREFNAFAFSAQGKMTIQNEITTKAAYAALAAPFISSTNTTYFDPTYGFYIYIGDGNQHVSFSTALALQAALRLYKYGGVSDGFTAATRFKDILMNTWRITVGAQKGAFRKLHNVSAGAFRCQEGGHDAAADHPHIAMYTQAECMQGLIEYNYISPNAAVQSALNDACDYLVSTQNAQGWWIVEQNNVGVATATNPNAGASKDGVATVHLAALMLEWSIRNSTATNAATWKKAALKGLDFHTGNFMNAPHGSYEYGEGYNGLSSQGLRNLVSGYSRAFRYTGNETYRRAGQYYFQMAIAQTKKVDSILNTAITNNKDVHTGGLLNTLDWKGEVGPEAMGITASLMSDGLRYNTDIREHDLFYLYAMWNHTTQGLRDMTNFTTPAAFGYSYISPGTGQSSVNQIDRTNMGFHPASLMLLLMANYYLASTDNPLIFHTAVDMDTVEASTNSRTIWVYNPQSTTQTANLKVNNLPNSDLAQVTCSTGGIIGTPVLNGANIIIPISLTAGQWAKINTN